MNENTVANGNGAEFGSHQLNQPTDIWISKKTGAMYIVDSINNRVQHWNLRASSGETVAGDSAGSSSSALNRLSSPFGIAINSNKTRMYVSEISNKRILRFELT